MEEYNEEEDEEDYNEETVEKSYDVSSWTWSEVEEEPDVKAESSDHTEDSRELLETESDSDDESCVESKCIYDTEWFRELSNKQER